MEGYRKNVAMVVFNDKQEVLICKRKGTENWQFPQGGIDGNEFIEDAMYRELYEEVGLKKKDVSIILVDKYLNKIKQFADKLYILDRGENVWNGKPSLLTGQIIKKYLSV